MKSCVLIFVMLLLKFPPGKCSGEGAKATIKPEPKAKLLVLLIGGLRWDHLDHFNRSNISGKRFLGFEKFLNGGVKTEYLESVFPAESFPAWQTISTGLNPEGHGIIGNQFVNNQLENNNTILFDFLNETTTSNPVFWNKTEPIWVTAKRQVSFTMQNQSILTTQFYRA